MPPCPCGSLQAYNDCCRPYLDGKAFANTAEKLMRSRYSAFCKLNIDYLEKTLGQTLKAQFNLNQTKKAQFNLNQTKRWAQSVSFQTLTIIETKSGQVDDQSGQVHFKATYKSQGQIHVLEEKSLFQKVKGRWLYVGAIEK